MSGREGWEQRGGVVWVGGGRGCEEEGEVIGQRDESGGKGNV